MKHRFRKNSQSGQVLITGIVMMSLLLLIIIYAFDVHNVIRAKLKVDIAQQSAAMTGALWQKESLNLLGEIICSRLQLCSLKVLTTGKPLSPTGKKRKKRGGKRSRTVSIF